MGPSCVPLALVKHLAYVLRLLLLVVVQRCGFSKFSHQYWVHAEAAFQEEAFLRRGETAWISDTFVREQCVR